MKLIHVKEYNEILSPLYQDVGDRLKYPVPHSLVWRPVVIQVIQNVFDPVERASVESVKNLSYEGD